MPVHCKNYYMLWVRSINFVQPLTEENGPAVLVKKIGAVLQEVGLLEHFSFYERTGGSELSPKKLTKFSNIVKQFERLAVKDLKTTRHVKLLTGDEMDIYQQEAFIGTNLRTSSISLNFLFTKEFIHKANFTIEQLIKLITCLYDAFDDIAMMGRGVELSMHMAEYPRPKPPRQHHQFQRGLLVHCFSKKYYAWDKHSKPETTSKLFGAKVPDGIKHWWHRDDLHIVQWVDDWLDDAQVAQRRTLQEKWISAAIDAPLETGYNEFGDKWEMRVGQPHVTPVFEYFGIWGNAYKKVSVNSEGKVDAQTLAELKGYLDAGIAPDGRKVTEMFVLVANRSEALSVYDQVTTAGLHGVLYPDPDGKWWNPFPEGEWER